MNQRFFRASESVYEQVRLTLDAAWGNPGDNAITCFEPAATAPRDSRGRVLLAVRSDFCEYDAVAAMLPDLLANGAVEEISGEEYESTVTWVSQ
jgi:hypothetical protein